MLKIAFFGTPQIAANLLNKILQDITFDGKIKFVVTQPDRPVGRKQISTASPVKKVAATYGLPVYTTLQLAMDAMSSIDVCLVFAYGEILKEEDLQMSPMGFWNIHPSLLPKYRGASPIAYPLILGETMTGVSLMKMDYKLDHGPVIVQEKLPITPNQTRLDLETRLTEQAYNLLKQLVVELNNDPKRISVDRLQEQNNEQATFTRTLQKDDGFIPLAFLTNALQNKEITSVEMPKIIQDYFQKNTKLSLQNWLAENKSSAQVVFNLFRGLIFWPGIWTNVKINNEDRRLKLSELEMVNGYLQIKQVQLEGKNVVDFQTFNAAYKLF